MKRSNPIGKFLVTASVVGALLLILAVQIGGASAAPVRSISGSHSAAHIVKVKAKLIGGVYRFSPSVIHIKVGTTVEWVNKSNTEHTVTSFTNAFPQHMLNKKPVRVKFKKAGSFKYHCTFHAGMNGKVVVKKH